MKRPLITAALIACVTLPAFADPDYCGPYRCTQFDLQHDRRADERKAARELDRRESLRDEQAQLDRSMDNMTRAIERQQDRWEREDSLR